MCESIKINLLDKNFYLPPYHPPPSPRNISPMNFGNFVNGNLDLRLEFQYFDFNTEYLLQLCWVMRIKNKNIDESPYNVHGLEEKYREHASSAQKLILPNMYHTTAKITCTVVRFWRTFGLLYISICLFKDFYDFE